MSEDAKDDSRKPDATRMECMGESVQASLNFRKARSSTQIAHHLRRRRIHLLQLQEAGSILGITGNSAGTLIQQEEDLDRRPNQARLCTLRSRSTAGKSFSRKHGETAKRCMPEGSERKGGAPMALANYARCRKGCWKGGGTGNNVSRRLQ